MAEIRTLDAGSWFGPSFMGERVPTLAEAVEVLGKLDLGANVEVKAARGLEAESGAAVADLLARLWPPHLPAPLISSFLPAVLAAARDRAPAIARGLLVRGVPRNWRTRADRLGCVTINAEHRLLRPALVAEIRESGYSLLAYTVNDAGRARELFGWGVSSVFSDVPHMIFDGAADGAARPAELSGPIPATRQGALS